MKKILTILGLAAGLSNATIIHWSASNDAQSIADSKAADGIYTGYIDLIEFTDGGVSSAWSNPDPLLNKFLIMDINTDMLYVSTSNVPGAIVGSALLSAQFAPLDLTAANLNTASGYTLKNVTINNSIGSAALNDFAATLAQYPGADYTFSSQGNYGNGQLGTVPEPASLGLMGLGLLGMGLMIRRKKA